MEKEVTIKSVGIKYGVLLGVASGILTIVLDLLGLTDNKAVAGSLSIAVIIAVMVLAMREFRTANDFMSFGEGFKIGALQSLVGGVISSVFLTIHMAVINPNYTQDRLEFNRKQMEEQPGMTEEALEIGISVTEKMLSTPVIQITSIVGALFIGAIFALIVAAIMKRSGAQEI